MSRTDVSMKILRAQVELRQAHSALAYGGEPAKRRFERAQAMLRMLTALSESLEVQARRR